MQKLFFFIKGQIFILFYGFKWQKFQVCQVICFYFPRKKLKTTQIRIKNNFSFHKWLMTTQGISTLRSLVIPMIIRLSYKEFTCKIFRHQTPPQKPMMSILLRWKFKPIKTRLMLQTVGLDKHRLTRKLYFKIFPCLFFPWNSVKWVSNEQKSSLKCN